MDNILQGARERYHANNDYDLEGSPTKARAFIKACRDLLQGPKSVGVSNNQVQFQDWRKELDKAEAWLSMNGGLSPKHGGSSASTYYDLSDIRQ